MFFVHNVATLSQLPPHSSFLEKYIKFSFIIFVLRTVKTHGTFLYFLKCKGNNTDVLLFNVIADLCHYFMHADINFGSDKNTSFTRENVRSLALATDAGFRKATE